MNILLFYLKAIIGNFAFIPHALCLIASGSTSCNKVKEDVIANKIISGSNLYLNWCALMWNPYFNTLFFNRIKSLKLRYFLLHIKGEFYIPHDVSIDGGCRLDHPFSTIINAKSIGKGLIIKNNTTIGNINDDDALRPTIGNHVFIGANSVIIGNIIIGNSVTIGAGAIVTKNVPDNSVVIGTNKVLQND